MPPLKNIKHEKFARAVIESPSLTKAYAKTYQVEPTKSAGNCASKILAESPAVKNRIAELLEKDGITIQRLNQKLGNLLEANSEEVQLRSARLGYELHGALDRGKYDESAKDILIQVNIMGRSGEETSVTI